MRVWYPGKVVEVERDEIFISFMEARSHKNVVTYVWPKRSDTVWLTKDEVQKIAEPKLTTGSKRWSRFTSAECDALNNKV